MKNEKENDTKKNKKIMQIIMRTSAGNHFFCAMCCSCVLNRADTNVNLNKTAFIILDQRTYNSFKLSPFHVFKDEQRTFLRQRRLRQICVCLYLCRLFRHFSSAYIASSSLSRFVSINYYYHINNKAREVNKNESNKLKVL